MQIYRHIVMTDFGMVDAPPHVIALSDACRPRKDGEPDRRFKTAKQLDAEVAKIIAAAREYWLRQPPNEDWVTR